MMPEWQPHTEAADWINIMLDVPLERADRWDAVAASIETATARETETMLRTLGLRGEYTIRARHVEPTAPFRIHLNGRDCRYPADLVTLLWRARVTDADLAANELPGALAFCLAAEREEARRPAVSFVVDLTLETLKLRPERLLRPTDVAFMADRIGGLDRLPTEATVQVGEAMAQLLALGLSCALEPRLLSHMSEIAAAGDPQDLTEQLITSSRDSSIELRVERTYLEDLLAEDVDDPLPLATTGEVGALIDRRLRGTFYWWGVRLPRLVFVADDCLPAHTARVRIGHLPGVLLPLPKRASPEIHETQTGSRPSSIDVAGLVDVFRRGIWLLIVRLTDIASLEYELSELDKNVPKLVRAALRRVTLAQLVRLVRGLLREGISVRNLRTILERLVMFSAVPAPVRGAFVFDDKLLLDERIAPDKQDMDVARLQFVRIGLLDAILTELLGSGFTPCVLTFDLDERLADHVAALANFGTGTLAGPDVLTLRDNLTAKLEEKSCTALITTASVRFWLRGLLCDGLPQIKIVARDEIRLLLPSDLPRIDTVEVWPTAGDPPITSRPGSQG
jgi:hypothetical protein